MPSTTIDWMVLQDIACYVLRAIVIALILSGSMLVALVLVQLHRISQAPTGITWSGLQTAVAFPKLRACLREPFVGRRAIVEGYEAFSMHGKPYILPGIPSSSIVLPPKDAMWLASQPEDILSVDALLKDSFGLQYFLNGAGKESVIDLGVLKRDLTRETLRLTKDVLDEIQSVFDEQLRPLADQKGWKEVSLARLIQHVGGRVANRIFVGLPLSRSSEYEENISRWAKVCGISALIMKFFIPMPLRPVLMRLIAIPTQCLHWWNARTMKPMVESRIKSLYTRSGVARRSITKARTHNDVTQWMIEANCRKTDPMKLDPASIVRQITLLNVGARGTLSTMTSLVLIDIIRYKNASSLIEELREEAAQYFSHCERDDNRSTSRNMVKLDSVIRESLRWNPMSGQGLMRKVVAAKGITTPDGVHLPCGAHVQTSVGCMQRDSRISGVDANEYDPLRHYHQQAHQPLLAGDSKSATRKQRLATQVSADYLSFGLGEHACPGRFWAVHAMKLIIGCLLANYDIHIPSGWEPNYVEVGDKVALSPKTMINTRRLGGPRVTDKIKGDG